MTKKVKGMIICILLVLLLLFNSIIIIRSNEFNSNQLLNNISGYVSYNNLSIYLNSTNSSYSIVNCTYYQEGNITINNGYFRVYNSTFIFNETNNDSLEVKIKI